MTTNGAALSAPLGLLAELTHRCPLGCPYCSNPLALDKRSDELDAATWARVFREAAALGVLQVHLSGGEPAARRDLVEIVKAVRDAGLYSNLITSAVGLTPQNLAALSDAGLDHVQISIQDSDEASAITSRATKALLRASGDGQRGRQSGSAAHRQYGGTSRQYWPHRTDGELALSLGASRVEIAHVQYYGWALKNRAALMPTREQVDEAVRQVELLRAKHQGRIVIDAVVPDYYARFPKPCVGGWGRRSLT
jgi:pyrroloquinoline quinone biosynthesis protein E